MVLIDVHCHIDIYEEKIKEIVKRAAESGVKIIVNAGITPKTNRKILELSEKFNEIKVALGVYPIETLKLSEKEIEDEINFIRKNKDKIVAIGEVGLDFKESQEKEKQTLNFEKFISLSLELDKPIIVHSRKAEQETIEILERKKARKVPKFPPV